jgi:hypothetical protein
VLRDDVKLMEGHSRELIPDCGDLALSYVWGSRVEK